MKTHTSTPLVAAAACLLLLTGCGTSSTPESPEPDLHSVYSASSWGGPEALITGELGYSEGCVWLIGDDGSQTYLILSSLGAPVVSGSTLTFDGTQYEVGSEVSFGGGVGIPANVSVACGGPDDAGWFTVSSPSLTESESAAESE